MKYSNWRISKFSASAARFLARRSSSLVGAVLSARGTDSEEEFCALLSDDIHNIHSPFLLKDMDKAVTRIQNAITENERVAVYGDYDADGITSTCLLVSFLRTHGLEPEIYIPNRLEEGYGLSAAAIQSLADKGVTLIITVDCGVTSAAEVEFAKSLGVDTVISDHHECKDELPHAAAVVNPKRPDCPYPYKQLAGVGVAFKVVCAMCRPSELETLLCRYGDLVAMGTVADIMPLTGENRILVKYGLRAVADGARPGVAALISSAGLDRAKITSENIGFTIAPRINAAGRMGKAEEALTLLLTSDTLEADRYAENLSALNSERRQIESDITEQVHAMLKAEGYESGPIIMACENWHSGVTGIVASKIMERYHAPAIIICMEDGIGKGSCRGSSGFNMFEALKYCGDSLIAFGGHSAAAGVTVAESDLEQFKHKFREYYNQHPPDAAADCLNIDFSVKNPGMLSLDNVTSLEELSPFGKGNPYPTLAIENALLRGVTPIGGGKHLKLKIEKWGQLFDCVYFGMSEAEFPPKPGYALDIAFAPKVNDFRNKRSVQLMISDIRPANWGKLEASLQLCGRFYGGEQITACEAKAICPDRSDFVCLWRHLSKADESGVISGVREKLLSGFVEKTWRGSCAKYYTCLKVMDELGLADLSEDDELIRIELLGEAVRVDLEGSALLQSIRRIQDTYEERLN